MNNSVQPINCKTNIKTAENIFSRYDSLLFPIVRNFNHGIIFLSDTLVRKLNLRLTFEIHFHLPSKE